MRIARVSGLLAILCLGAAFVLINRAEASTALSSLREADRALLSLAVACAAGYLVAYAALVWTCMASAGLRLTFPRAALVGTAAHFYNLAIVYSGGLGGVGVAVGEARRMGERTGKAVAGYLLVSQIGHFTFAAVLAAALLLEFSAGSLSPIEVAAASVFVAYCVALIATMVAIVTSERLFLFVHRIEAAILGRVRHMLRLHEATDEAASEPALEMRTVLRDLFRKPRAFSLPVFSGVLVELAGIATLWATLAAYGVHTGVMTPLTAYAVGVLFSIVSFLPAGLGFAEAGLGLSLRRAGVDGPSTVLVVVTFRLLETWLPFVAGASAALLVRRVKRNACDDR
ncbi:MAG: YbhN family protein [Dehalococcoidia bacterium]